MYDHMTTAEVAAYLRLKERKVYDLVRQGQIPCVRITGKLLFPRQAVDLWVMNHLEGDQPTREPVPSVLAGSQDPLLDWAVRESGSELAVLCHGSGDGVRRLLEAKAMVAGLHLIDPVTGDSNRPQAIGLGGMRDLVIVRWAIRRQGLLFPRGNPKGIRSMQDLGRGNLRVAYRQPEAGADSLFRWLLARCGLDRESLQFSPHASLTEDDLALTVRAGEADVGLAVEAAARRHGLEFLPLHEEPFDLAMRRRSYFEPAIQRLLSFARSARFEERARAMGGYDVSTMAMVIYNA
jgi:excisionase family DNA binding protein